jgi:hypothetical protein
VRSRKKATRKNPSISLIYKSLYQLLASENRFFSFAKPRGRENRKDEALEIHIFEEMRSISSLIRNFTANRLDTLVRFE